MLRSTLRRLTRPRNRKEFTIRLADTRDLLTVAFLMHKLEDEDGNPWGQAKRLPCYFEKEAALRLGDGLGRMWIAFEVETDRATGEKTEGRPVGQIFVRVEDWREGFASCFFVEQDAPRETAYLLLRAAAQWFTIKECVTVHIATGPKNHTRKAYKRMGFAPTQYIQTAKINDIRVGLHLSAIELPPEPITMMQHFAK